jgi:hypothetical protein
MCTTVLVPDIRANLEHLWVQIALKNWSISWKTGTSPKLLHCWCCNDVWTKKCHKFHDLHKILKKPQVGWYNHSNVFFWQQDLKGNQDCQLCTDYQWVLPSSNCKYEIVNIWYVGSMCNSSCHGITLFYQITTTHSEDGLIRVLPSVDLGWSHPTTVTL